MRKFSCPSCGAEVIFQSTTTIFTVCKFCRSTLVRRDLDLENIGKMADLKGDSSPLQLGTTGRYKGDFILLGRVQVSWQDGFWNEWFVRFNDGREGWLAEAQGFYMLSFKIPAPSALPKPTELRPDLEIQIGDLLFVVDDIKQVTYTFAEGELPFAAPQGFKGTSVDLRHGENDFASISFSSTGEMDTFVGQYLDFAEFQFQNLRQLDDW